MSMNITIRDSIYERLKKMKQEIPQFQDDEPSFSDVIEELFINQNLKEVIINQEGRFENSKALAGKNILYKIKT